MAIANLKLIFGGSTGGSLTLKAGQSYLNALGVGGVTTGSIDVSSPTNVINLTGKWALSFIEIVCASAGTGTMSATLTVDGVAVVAAASIGTAQYINFYGASAPANGTVSNYQTPSQPIIICNTNMSLTLQRSTADTITVRYIALAIE